jgi:hypothetical protein
MNSISSRTFSIDVKYVLAFSSGVSCKISHPATVPGLCSNGSRSCSCEDLQGFCFHEVKSGRYD